MSYSIRPTPAFQKQFRKLLKKYRSLANDILVLQASLLDSPTQGTPLGRDCYKIRMAITRKNRGKSGGARIITNVHIVGQTVYLLSIYDKSDRSTLDEGELDELLKEVDS